MTDWLAIWGVTSAVGFIFKPILEDLAKDAAKDWTKDLFKDSLKNVLHLPKKEPLEKAAGKAVKEFLQLFQQELEDAEISEEELKEYTKPHATGRKISFHYGSGEPRKCSGERNRLTSESQ